MRNLSVASLAMASLGAMALPAAANTITVINDLGTNPTAVSSAPLVVNSPTTTFADAYTFTVSGAPQYVVSAVAANTYAKDASFIQNFQVSLWSVGSDGTAGTGDDVELLGPSSPSIVPPPPGSQSASVAGALLSSGKYYFEVQGIGSTNTSYNGSVDTVSRAVPGPMAGAGLPGLIAACGAMLALARRRRSKTA